MSSNKEFENGEFSPDKLVNYASLATANSENEIVILKPARSIMKCIHNNNNENPED